MGTCSLGIVQIHPTRLCNLQCLHCYTESGPEARGWLTAQACEEALASARQLGFQYVSISGGEPLLWRDLVPLLRGAKGLGYVTSLTTNGTLLRDRLVESLAPHVDRVAISVDGPPQAHDELRGAGAFTRLEAGMAALRRAGVPFGLVFTLTQYNCHHFDWLLAFAADNGAMSIQVHPLEMAGRARATLDGAAPSMSELLMSLWNLARLGRCEPYAGVKLRFDATTVAAIRAEVEGLFTCTGPECAPQVLSPLIIEPSGRIVPLVYGMPQSLELGRLGDGDLQALVRRWFSERLGGFTALCRQALATLASMPPHQLVNWPALVHACAEEQRCPVGIQSSPRPRPPSPSRQEHASLPSAEPGGR